jgi:cyclopentanol dehydrogenase
MGRVTGKVAIVTGGGSGMGRSHAQLLASEGASVMVTDCDLQSGQQTVATITAAAGRAAFHHHDVSSESDWMAVIAATLAAFERIDILINNAGIGLAKPTRQTSLEEWDRVQNINCRGTFIGCREVIAPMTDAGGGSIINVSSSWALAARAGFAAYCASKGAVRLFSKALAAELAVHNIRVNSLHPGTIETNLTKPVLTSPEAIDFILGPQPIRRPGTPLEVSQAVLFLASDESSYVTGTEMVVDGGYNAV